MFIICLDYELRMSMDLIKEKWFHVKKKLRSRRYPAETMTDADDLALFANLLAQADYLLHSREQAAGNIVNANKVEFMCFKQEGAITTLSGKPLK